MARPRNREKLALVAYVVGLVLAVPTALGAIVALAHGDVMDSLERVAIALAYWWIAAGIGWRLGISPAAFWTRLGIRTRDRGTKAPEAKKRR